jgi:hypothetical protein
MFTRIDWIASMKAGLSHVKGAQYAPDEALPQVVPDTYEIFL